MEHIEIRKAECGKAEGIKRKGGIFNMHPIHPLIFEYHPGQNLRPIE
jgi:hypothetical protein